MAFSQQHSPFFGFGVADLCSVQGERKYARPSRVGRPSIVGARTLLVTKGVATNGAIGRS